MLILLLLDFDICREKLTVKFVMPAKIRALIMTEELKFTEYFFYNLKDNVYSIYLITL